MVPGATFLHEHCWTGLRVSVYRLGNVTHITEQRATLCNLLRHTKEAQEMPPSSVLLTLTSASLDSAVLSERQIWTWLGGAPPLIASGSTFASTLV